VPAASARSALLGHLHERFPGRVIDEAPAIDARIEDRAPGFQVFRVQPAHPGDWWLYVTSGRWESTQHDGHGVEFVLAAPRDEWPAWRHWRAASTKRRSTRSIRGGHPWSELTHAQAVERP
jgi:hypothetical protein